MPPPSKLTPASPSTVDERRQLRRQLREQRAELRGPARARAEYRLAAQVMRLRAFHQARHIAAYLASGSEGEVDVSYLIEVALRAGKAVYVPVMRPDLHLDFARFTHETRLRANFFGLDEPVFAERQLIAPMQLDLVLTPLVGFDAQGNRLGMGGGYYDRTFAPLLQRPHYRRPRLLGVAFECQRVDTPLPMERWDVPLWRVVTEAGCHPR